MPAANLPQVALDCGNTEPRWQKSGYARNEIALTVMLTGPDLLARIKELGSIPRSELVRKCGYVSTRKDGRQRLNFTAFYEALLEAKGMHLGVATNRERRRPGRHLSYCTRVLFNGNLLVGSAYTAQLGLRPGDAFEIRLGRHQIRLIPAGSSEEVDDPSETVGGMPIPPAPRVSGDSSPTAAARHRTGDGGKN
jgi:AbrB-like transcriptional regulator